MGRTTALPNEAAAAETAGSCWLIQSLSRVQSDLVVRGHWIEKCPEDMELVSSAVQAVADILAGRVVVEVQRYRFLSFEPYFLGTFHSASEAKTIAGVQVVSWSNYHEFAQQFAAANALPARR